MRYDEAAVERCQRLYLKYNGQQFERIEQEMRKFYPSWNKSYLHNRGRGKNAKEGWIAKFNWEKALAIHLAQRPTATLNSAEQLVREIDEVRGFLHVEIKAQGGKVDKERLQLHRDYCNLSISALTKVEAARDTLGAFVAFWEKLLDWMPGIDMKAARALVKHSEAIITKAEEEFGESESMLESLMNGNKNSAAETIAGPQA